MFVFWLIFLFIIGAALGSFVGALVYRLKKGGKFWQEFWKMKGKYSHSVCEKCGHRLNALDLIPVASWIFLRGKCRYCHKPIGWSALFLEVGVGLSFVISFIFWPNNLMNADQIFGFILWLIAIILMAALMIYDIRWKILPNKFMWPLIGVSLIYAVINFVALAMNNWSEAWIYLGEISLALIPVFGVYLVLHLISRGKWVGFGDVKFGIIVALLLADWRAALIVLAGANLMASLFVLPQLITKKLKTNSQIAFGPFLIIATFFAFIFKEPIIKFIEQYLFLI